MSVEVEIKLKINSRTDIERVLEETGFVRADLVLESDTYYTSDHHDFAALDEAFRVRSTENRMTGKRSATITYKGAKMDNISMTRQELETTVGDAKICRKILEHIGFRPIPPVEKLRQYFHRENITACVDTVTNLGDYLELEIIVETEEKKEAASVKEEDAVPMDLTEEQKYNFSYFATVAGLSQQIASALYMVMKKMKSTDQTSRVGNLIILGAEGSGKSTLGIRFAKTISEEKGEESVKIAKIYAEDFNKKDIPSTVAKIAGGTLIIEEAGDLDDAVVEQLSKAMEFRTDALLVVLEDEKKYLKELFEKHPDFAEKFTSEIVIPVFTNDELVEFGRTYAYEEDYTIDEEAIPTLYERISELQEAGRPVTVIDVKEIVDEAIRQSEKIGFRKLSMVLSKKRYDADDRVILYEKDFR